MCLFIFLHKNVELKIWTCYDSIAIMRNYCHHDFHFCQKCFFGLVLWLWESYMKVSWQHVPSHFKDNNGILGLTSYVTSVSVQNCVFSFFFLVLGPACALSSLREGDSCLSSQGFLSGYKPLCHRAVFTATSTQHWQHWTFQTAFKTKLWCSKPLCSHKG